MIAPRFCYKVKRLTSLCHHWRCAIKRTFWPCRHGVRILAGGTVQHKSIMVSSTQAGNVYRCTFRCRRCQIVVMRFEGQINERLSEEVALIILDEATDWDPDLWDKLENMS